MRLQAAAGAAILLGVFLTAGCGQSDAVRKMSDTPRPPDIPRSAAIDKLYVDPMGMQRVYMLMDNEDLNAVKSFVATPDFKERITNFVADPIPEKAASPQREESKKKLVKLLQDLNEAGKKKVADAEFKKTLDQISPAWAEFLKPL